MHKWKVILRYGLFFMLGLVLGMAGSRLAHKHRFAQAMQNRPAIQRQMMMRQLTRGLNLTKSQQIEIAPIIDVQIKAFSEMRERHEPEIRAIFQQAQEAIKPHLLPAQRQKLDQLMERMQKRGPMHRPPPPPP